MIVTLFWFYVLVLIYNMIGIGIGILWAEKFKNRQLRAGGVAMLSTVWPIVITMIVVQLGIRCYNEVGKRKD